MKDVAALSRIKRLLSPRRNELAAGADDAHGESRQQLAVRWSSNSSGLFPPPTTPPLSDPTTNHPCWKVFGRRWRRGLAKSYRVICLLRRRTTSGRRGGKEDEETKDRGLWRKWWRTERGLALSTFNDWSICCVAWTRNWWNFILFNREEKKFE